MRIIAIWLLLINLVSPAFATTYYLRADGSAANKGASTSCATAGAAMSITTHNSQTFSGDDSITICDSGGTYTGATLTPPSAGTAGHPINYIVSGTPTIDGTGKTYAFDANNKSYLTVNGPLTLTSATSQDIYVRGSSNSTFTSITATAGGSAGWLIRNLSNTSFINDDANSTVSSTGIGYQADSNDTNLTFTNSTAENNKGDGFLMDGITGCTFNGGSASNNGTITNEGNGIDVLQESGGTPTTNCNINNFVSHDNYGNGIDVISVTLGDTGNSNIVITGGQFYHNLTGVDNAAGVRFDDNTASSTVQFAQIYNNNGPGLVTEASATNDTFASNQIWGNQNGITQSNSPGSGNVYIGNVSYANIFDGFQIATGGSAAIVENNVFYLNGRYGYNSDGSVTDTTDYNVNFGNVTANYNGITKPTHDINSDPLFTNASSDIFTLQSGSPAINAGVTLSTNPNALLPQSQWPNGIGIAPQGLLWTIGAFLPAGSGIPYPVNIAGF